MSVSEQLLVAKIFPHDKPLDNVVQALTLGTLRLFGRKLVRVTTGVVNELGEKHRPSGSQGTTSPPEVQRGRVPLSNRLLP